MIKLMSIVLMSEDQNIGSAYQLADGTYAWNMMVEFDGNVEFRNGRHRFLKQAGEAMLAEAIKIGVPLPMIEHLNLVIDG